MPDFVDNTAGYSEVTGTADYLMTTTGTGLHLRLDQALVDAQEVAYYAVGTSNGVDAFESGTATWDDSENTLVVDAIINSSNGGGKISWDAGDKTIYIVANSATMVNTADERLVRTDVGDLDPATSLDGTELFPASQGGDPVAVTAQQIAGTPLTNVTSHALNRRRDYSDFSKAPSYLTTLASGSLFGVEPYEVAHSGTTGAAILNFPALLFDNVVSMGLGSSSSAHVGIKRVGLYIPFTTTKDFKTTWKVAVNLPDLTDDATFQTGFLGDNFPSLAGQGMYFELTGASANWFACVKNAGGTERVSTGVVAVAATYITTRVFYDSAALATKFYINGDLVATITNATRVVADSHGLVMGVTARKTAGTGSLAINVFNHQYDIPGSIAYGTLEDFA